MRLAVYTDYPYHRVGGEVYAERAFALFVAELAPKVDRLSVVGRLRAGGEGARYPLGDVDLVALPDYRSLAEPLTALGALGRSVSCFWRALDQIDTVWLLGPHPLAFAFLLVCALRRRRVVLGVRQESVEYVRSRHPGRHGLLAAASLMELGFRVLGRALPVIVVGPRLAHTYRRSRSLLEIAVSLVRSREIPRSQVELKRDYDGQLTVLSVGRIDSEKNPLALADVLGLLPGKWRMVVCGEGPLEADLRNRCRELGVEDRIEFRGYVRHDALVESYLASHALLHISWTEGLPQVLFEAFAAGLPTVATDVGGIGEAVEGAALLVPPGRPDAAAAALQTLGRDAPLRDSLVGEGLALARQKSIESETDRVAAFLAGDGSPSRRAQRG